VIGIFGSVVFETSSDRVRTFADFKRSGEARYGEHGRIGRKGILEFLGPGIEQISFSMLFSVSLGLNPRTEIDRLRDLRDAGEVETLILGGKPLGDFVVTSLSETWKRMDNAGRLLAAETAVTLKEYPDVDS